MTNQQILEMLSENEYILFYTLDDDPDNEALRAAHKSIKQALIDFAHATGCRLNYTTLQLFNDLIVPDTQN